MRDNINIATLVAVVSLRNNYVCSSKSCMRVGKKCCSATILRGVLDVADWSSEKHKNAMRLVIFTMVLNVLNLSQIL